MPLFLKKTKVEENPIEQVGEILLLVNKGEQNIEKEENEFVLKLNKLNFENDNVSEISKFEFLKVREEMKIIKKDLNEIVNLLKYIIPKVEHIAKNEDIEHLTKSVNYYGPQELITKKQFVNKIKIELMKL